MPADVSAAELDRAVRAELRSLSKANAEMVGRHLVMTGRLLVEDPDRAYAHAMAAQRRAGRIFAVREAVGLAAYHAGLWSQALAEMRAARRMSGSSHQLPLMADCERGLGRPERAIELATSPQAAGLSAAERVEMAIVVSGARRDLGQADAAVLAVQLPELTARDTHAFTPRLRYAYADALLAAGRDQEADHWFALAADSDRDGVTDADERLAELRGVEIIDLLDAEPYVTAAGDGSGGDGLGTGRDDGRPGERLRAEPTTPPDAAPADAVTDRPGLPPVAMPFAVPPSP